MYNKTLTEFTELLASKAAVPGGGGAAGLVGALSASLGCMAANLTSGKKKFKDVQPLIEEKIEVLNSLRLTFLEDINKDAECFEPLSKAYSIPKDDPTRNEVLESCLHQAAQGPYNLLVHTTELIEHLQQLLPMTSALVISDVATAASLAESVLKCAAINVTVNTKLMTDKQYAASLNTEVEKLVADYSEIASNLYKEVYERMK